MKIQKCIGLLLAAVLAGGTFTGCGDHNTVSIVNVSYDPTRELYTDYNTIFAEHWKEQTGQDVEVIQSHGGSGKQALEVANGWKPMWSRWRWNTTLIPLKRRD